jgi:hypothetical protein
MHGSSYWQGTFSLAAPAAVALAKPAIKRNKCFAKAKAKTNKKAFRYTERPECIFLVN